MQTYKTVSGHLWSVCLDGHVHIEANKRDLRLDPLDVMAMDALLMELKPQPKGSLNAAKK
jgi:hypothetical protein